MSYAEVKQYIETAPIVQFESLIKVLENRKEQIETDRAIRRAQKSMRAGKGISSVDMNKYLVDSFGV
ncbi:hypothetical protein FACS189431_3160 [Alphaproteobacteria bacterium]|nr:hypothetical protein FACS189431_3160 [Alphaproteobacteria bacterium]